MFRWLREDLRYGIWDMQRMIEVAQRGGVVARVHSGDPALYGATHEQIAGV